MGGFRREIDSFMERWVYGSGCPTIRAAFSLRRGNDNIIEVALQQRGSTAARTAARRALTQDKNNAAGVIRVLVRELEATTEHAVFLGSEARNYNSHNRCLSISTQRLQLAAHPRQPSKQGRFSFSRVRRTSHCTPSSWQ